MEPEDQPEDVVEESGDEPQGTDSKDSQSSGTDSKNLSAPTPKAKGARNKPKGLKPKPKGAKPHGTKLMLLTTLSTLVQLLLPQRVY